MSLASRFGLRVVAFLLLAGLLGACSGDGNPSDPGEDTCRGDACAPAAEVTACAAASDCPVRPCADATCDAGVCTYAAAAEPDPADGCCADDAGCDDGRACTTDRCEALQCKHERLDPNCCDGNADCTDIDVCTVDACVSGRCMHQRRSDCCASDAACDDSDACTADRCVQGECVHPRESTCPCTGAPQCDDGNPCSTDLCLALPQGQRQCQYERDYASPAEADCCDPLISEPQCDDGDPVTADACDLVTFRCTHTPQLVCEDDAACADDDPCTVHVCSEAGFCVLTNPDAVCCQSDAECDDGSDCSFDLCDAETLTCVHAKVPTAGCCETDAECDDALACSVDTCDLSTFLCEHDQTGCECAQNIDCDDANNCTTDTCQNGQCHHMQTTNCCEIDADCDDQNPCTTDTCYEVNKSCYYEQIAGCCNVDADCEDGNECTSNRCNADRRCQLTYIPNCCVDAGQCNDSDACTIDTCVDSWCQYETKPSPCYADGDCPAPGPCQQGRCVNCTCITVDVPDCCANAADCDDDDDLCTTERCVDSHCVYTVTDEPDCCLVPTDCTPENWCFEPSCSAGHRCSYAAIPNCCLVDADCADGEEICTLDTCVDGECVHASTGAEGCCANDGDCTSLDPCQAGSCDATGTCQFAPIPAPDCCHDDGECNDGDDECTNDFCRDNVCAYESTGLPQCCSPWEWVDEIDDCGSSIIPIPMAAAEEPAEGDCRYTFVNTNQGMAGLFGAIGWQTVSQGGELPIGNALVRSAPTSIYYGDAMNGTYAAGGMMGEFMCMFQPEMCGPHEGTCTSESIEVGADPSSMLSFWLYLDIRSDPDVDHLTVSIVDETAGNEVVEVWSKEEADPGLFGDWQLVEIPIVAYASHTVRVQWYFGTVDAPEATGLGIYLDDIRLGDNCSAE